MKPVLVILAAGLGSRYGGLKQIDVVGPNGELIIDYSVYDALKAGFKKIIFVIRRDFELIFKGKVGDRYKDSVEIDYAFQEMDGCLKGNPIPEGRQKPWGTGHAILAAKELINDPFTVINADDFYGQDTYHLILNYITSTEKESRCRHAMAGYILEKTLSDHGHVSRGICDFNQNMELKKVVERTQIANVNKKIFYTDSENNRCILSGKEIVSMNFWGLQPDIFSDFERLFQTFLSEKGNDLDSEFYLPSAIDQLIQADHIKVQILPTLNTWFGITYPEDRIQVARMISELIHQGRYPKTLF